ncbi:MAG: GntR family transcriptional regulator [Candidatus Omnitrophica bacterium]|nr:GntR family transcriptional regulator [Candidatus Omnitrophota bacterium]
MRIKINPNNGLAPYLQIIKQVKYLVACGALKAGDQLPPVRDLAMQLRINPNTVARAYRELRYDKIITSKWGGGTFISEEVKQIAESEKKKIIAEILGQAIHQAASLGLTKEEITRLFTTQLKKAKVIPKLLK